MQLSAISGEASPLHRTLPGGLSCTKRTLPSTKSVTCTEQGKPMKIRPQQSLPHAGTWAPMSSILPFPITSKIGMMPLYTHLDHHPNTSFTPSKHQGTTILTHKTITTHLPDLNPSTSTASASTCIISCSYAFAPKEKEKKTQNTANPRRKREVGEFVFLPSGKEKPIVDSEVGTHGAHGWLECGGQTEREGEQALQGELQTPKPLGCWRRAWKGGEGWGGRCGKGSELQPRQCSNGFLNGVGGCRLCKGGFSIVHWISYRT